MKATVAPLLAGNTLGSANNNFVIAEWRDPGGESSQPRLIAPPHVHFKDDEAWYVLEGEICVQRGDEVVRAPAGAGVLVSRGTPHTYWNPGPGPARYLLIMTAGIHQLIQDIHELKDRTPERLAALFHQHASELVRMESGA